MKKCAIVLLVMTGLFVIVSMAMADPWKNSLDFGLNLTQNAYSRSWTGGEIGNVVWMSLANGLFEKQVSPKFNFRNTTKLQFGETIAQDEVTKDWHRPIKSTDKIELDNLGRFTLHAFVDPYVDLGFISQFYDASYKPKKSYFNPIMLTESAGVAKTLYKKDKNEVITRLGFALRQNFVIDTLFRITATIPADTIPPSLKRKSTGDGGFEWVSETHYGFAKNLVYTAKLTVFEAVFFSGKDKFKGTEAENYWKAPHVNMENTLAASVTKYVVVTFYSQLLYDKLISKAGRFKETLALGLTYKFI